MTKIKKYFKNNCNPCSQVSLFLESNGVENVEEINVFENPEEAASAGIMSVPVTILLDDNGNEIQRSIGFRPDELSEIISKL